MQVSNGLKRLGVWPGFIIFFLLSHRFGLAPAALAALVYGAGFLASTRRDDSVSKLDYGVFAFWAAGLVAALYRPDWARLYFQENSTSFLYLGLLGAALLPLIFGREPFTCAFAKKKTDPAFWPSWQFVRVNQFMTLGWAAIFLVGLLLTLRPGPLMKIGAPILLSLVVGIPFTRRFPDWFMRNVHQDPWREKSSPPGQTSCQSMPEFKAKNVARETVARQAGPIKKALIIFGSPRGAKGHTYTMLQELIRGMTAGGIACDTVMLHQQRINPCAGCFSCWTQTPGICIHHDDMVGLLSREDEADLLIFAQPLYIFSVPGITKNYLDRRLPRIQPYLVAKGDGTTTHPHRYEQRSHKMLIFSVCGFPEISHFAGLLTMFRQMAQSAAVPIVGEILRPSSESLRFGARMSVKHREIMASLYEAGQQLARQGYVATATEAAISQPLFASLNCFRQTANFFWDTWIAYEERKRRGEKLAELDLYLQEDPGMFFHGMASQYNHQQAAGFTGSIQFNLTDRDESGFYLTIRDGACSCAAGCADAPQLTIDTPWAVWLAIAEGKLSGAVAARDGQYQVSGDLGLLWRLEEIFDGGVAA